MKKTIIIVLALVLSFSFCAAQSQSLIEIKREIEQKYQNAVDSAKENVRQGRYDAAINSYQEALKLIPENADSINAEIDKIKEAKQEAEAKRQKALEEQRRREAEQRYQDAVASAERNSDAGQYAQAKSDYLAAIEIKPGSAALFDIKIAELDTLILKKAMEDAIAELERQYQEAIAFAEMNVAQRRYAEAKQQYLTALELKPENAYLINAKIAEIEKPAVFHIYRKNISISTIGDILGGQRYDVFLDDVVVGQAKSKWKTTVTIDDLGTKTISAAIDGRRAEIYIDSEPGKFYYIRCEATSREIKTGEWKTRKKLDGTTERYEETIMEYTPKFNLVDINVGEQEFNSIKIKEKNK